VAKRREAELAEKPDYLSGCPQDWAASPKPGKSIIVGIGGGYVRNKNDIGAKALMDSINYCINYFLTLYLQLSSISRG